MRLVTILLNSFNGRFYYIKMCSEKHSVDDVWRLSVLLKKIYHACSFKLNICILKIKVFNKYRIF